MSKARPFKLYETMYILRPDLSEEQTEQTIEKYQKMLTDLGATQIETLHRSRRRLAYEIQGHRDGVYIQMNYQGNVAIEVMERAMRQSEEVLRSLTIRLEDPKASPKPAAEVPVAAAAAAPAPVETSSTVALQR